MPRLSCCTRSTAAYAAGAARWGRAARASGGCERYALPGLRPPFQLLQRLALCCRLAQSSSLALLAACGSS